MTGKCPVAKMLSQDTPETYPPSATFDPNAGIPYPVIHLGDLIELSHALQRVDARDKY